MFRVSILIIFDGLPDLLNFFYLLNILIMNEKLIELLETNLEINTVIKTILVNDLNVKLIWTTGKSGKNLEELIDESDRLLSALKG